MSQYSQAADRRMRELFVLTEEEIRKLKEKMEAYSQGGAFYMDVPPDLMEIKDTQRQLHNLELLRERLLHKCPWLDTSKQDVVVPKPVKVPLC